MPPVTRLVGVDYSGAATADTRLPGLRVCIATPSTPAPVELLPPLARRWTRRELAHAPSDLLANDMPTLIGIDHALGLPRSFLDAAGWPLDWSTMLDRFVGCWPMANPGATVAAVRRDRTSAGGRLPSNARWRRACDHRCGAKSPFHFDVPGSVATSTHAGLAWIAWLRERHPDLHVWPFDGWTVPAGASAIAEAWPALVSGGWPRDGRSPDLHDAWCLARWMAESSNDGALDRALCGPDNEDERTLARVEGWILGV
jgi:hypothetical protein